MANIVGTPNNDVLPGTVGNDTITGLAGNDVLNNDLAFAGGFDILFGNMGFDSLNLGASVSGIAYGGQDNDRIVGSNGVDTIYGDNGADILFGASANDVMVGTNVLNDQFNDGADQIFGGNNSDTLYGNSGNDSVAGESGNDVIFGGRDNDNLNGNNDTDIVSGDLGNDTLSGGPGVDTVTGGANADVFVGIFGSGGYGANTDEVTDFQNEDRISFSGGANITVIPSVQNGDLYVDARSNGSTGDYSRLILKGRSDLRDVIFGYIVSGGAPFRTANTANTENLSQAGAASGVKIAGNFLGGVFDDAVIQSKTDELVRGFTSASNLPSKGATVLPSGTDLKQLFKQGIERLEKGLPIDNPSLKNVDLAGLKDALADIESAEASSKLLELRNKGLLPPGSIDPFTGNQVPLIFDPSLKPGSLDLASGSIVPLKMDSLL